MPRDGSVTRLRFARRRSRSSANRAGGAFVTNVERLIAEHGADAKLPDLLVALANCDKARSVSISGRCRARYERYYGG